MAVLHGSAAEICYVTYDLDHAVEHWSKGAGAGPFYAPDNPAEFGERSYRGAPARDSFRAALGFSGNTLIEFVQPTNDEPSVFQEVLKAKGEMAVYHFFPNIRPISCAEYDAAYDRYLAMGYVASLEMILPGLGRCTLFDARGQLGVFVELLEISPEMYAGLERMYAAHVDWDGQRPMREFLESMA